MKVAESKGKGSSNRLKEEWNVGQLGSIFRVIYGLGRR